MIDKKVDVTDILGQWSKIFDKAKYLKSEHDLKEKEYGIPWRSAYKTVILSIVLDLEKVKLVNERAQNSEQAFEIIARTSNYVFSEIEKNQKSAESVQKLT